MIHQDPLERRIMSREVTLMTKESAMRASQYQWRVGVQSVLAGQAEYEDQ
jgi:hypothetical protein